MVKGGSTSPQVFSLCKQQRWECAVHGGSAASPLPYGSQPFFFEGFHLPSQQFTKAAHFFPALFGLRGVEAIKRGEDRVQSTETEAEIGEHDPSPHLCSIPLPAHFVRGMPPKKGCECRVFHNLYVFVTLLYFPLCLTGITSQEKRLPPSFFSCGAVAKGEEVH